MWTTPKINHLPSQGQRPQCLPLWPGSKVTTPPPGQGQRPQHLAPGQGKRSQHPLSQGQRSQQPPARSKVTTFPSQVKGHNIPPRQVNDHNTPPPTSARVKGHNTSPTLARVKGHNTSPSQGQRLQQPPPPGTMRRLAVRILLECILVGTRFQRKTLEAASHLLYILEPKRQKIIQYHSFLLVFIPKQY